MWVFTSAAGAGRVAGLVFRIVRDVSVVGLVEGGVRARVLAARGGMRFGGRSGRIRGSEGRGVLRGSACYGSGVFGWSRA